ncbi:hypothetical protein RM531_12470 [Salinisphaera sp. P385]|uniref:DUF2946 domain-containing protein n=1 Tax=Spectribacter acetivorans TaxID=3075603 RepID=A0ABU3BDP7_9GAMM|nr:hypothetical protein [Salinisphaera sp. P385]MDT0619291.1 hypothetical protein [Salinisphaera sp. P385]
MRLLITALLAVQLLGAAHAFEHPAIDHADHACVVCAHGSGLDAAPPAGTATTSLPATHGTPAPATLRRPPARPVLAYRSRAPPVLS